MRRRGFKRGLISVCSSDVEEAWAETELAPHLDDFVLSCTVGLTKPDTKDKVIEQLAAQTGRRIEAVEIGKTYVFDGTNHK